MVEHDHVVTRADLEHADLALEGLKLTLKGKKGETKEILDGSIRARAQPGRLLAIMGPSGTDTGDANQVQLANVFVNTTDFRFTIFSLVQVLGSRLFCMHGREKSNTVRNSRWRATDT